MPKSRSRTKKERKIIKAKKSNIARYRHAILPKKSPSFDYQCENDLQVTKPMTTQFEKYFFGK